ncbi:hypothetical protein SCH01S_29_00370 [Sphingomonas changbaiensis NBRC 104936]|uniref:Uncharacterized protein n=1 Tax=Sphingomonas changbaiensis NBRC 104936 TaxID=1219043 RepID=A0A0E9MP63_9SPHN|nr:phage tail protein [Sphingomonas changbaiensis]GAO39349.1 hypothetical protein SCH01S_29_00370 [Sphingomonas changbaiensis NBRC 104936]
MATLVLMAAGSVLGPAGRAVGALIGQSIDAQIFKLKGREGPRLQDLKIQMSSYGAPIPKLFGTMRVAGTVIWATDLVEHRSKQGGGKGRPSTTTYSYTASFAVLLSARPIRSVGRIWADGNLLRGIAGDWKSETAFRLHLGDEDQDADPFIASAEGLNGTPAYRGCAYAVFENMALGPFGNRIPSLSFEIEADSGPTPLGPILAELSGDALVASGGTALRGFAASGDSVRAVVETLGQAVPIILRTEDDGLRMVEDLDEPFVLDAEELAEARSETLAADSEVPGLLALSYYEPARDYQAGVQQARRPAGRRTDRIELAASLEAGEARALAEAALARRVRERGQQSVKCGWARLPLSPGAIVRVADQAGLWRVTARSIDREGVRLDLKRVAIESMAVQPAEPGRNVTAPDRVHGPTVLHLLDLPNLTDSAPTTPRLYIAAAGASPGWRRATLMASLDGGASWAGIGGTAAPAVIGTTISALPPAGEALLDTAHKLDVQLLHNEMQLEDADPDRLIGGANLALVGNELIQFGRAAPLGEGCWRLSQLMRGRRGTGWAAVEHAAGDRFVLIEPETLFAYDPPLSAAGADVQILASGIGDPIPVVASAAAIGEALRPPPPVHVSAERRDDGGFALHWIRESRVGWSWLDASDAPLGEDSERYRLTIMRADGTERSYELGSAGFDYAAADVSVDASVGPTVTISVVQIGTSAASRAAAITLTL